jgi:hypothetical protein
MSDRDMDYKNPHPRVSSLLCVRLGGENLGLTSVAMFAYN